MRCVRDSVFVIRRRIRTERERAGHATMHIALGTEYNYSIQEIIKICLRKLAIRLSMTSFVKREESGEPCSLERESETREHRAHRERERNRELAIRNSS